MIELMISGTSLSQILSKPEQTSYLKLILSDAKAVIVFRASPS